LRQEVSVSFWERPWAWIALGAQGAPLSPEEGREFIVAEPSSVPPASTFIVRFWREWSVAGSRWRGRIEHVESGESTAFLTAGRMLEFMQGTGVMTDHAGERTKAGV
jgi:hypothetical protein